MHALISPPGSQCVTDGKADRIGRTREMLGSGDTCLEDRQQLLLSQQQPALPLLGSMGSIRQGPKGPVANSSLGMEWSPRGHRSAEAKAVNAVSGSRRLLKTGYQA